MKIQELVIENIIVGSGAAGYRAALQLHGYGINDLAVLTENVKSGTSRNTGSDKQTYYKLSIAGKEKDSVLQMAEDLFNGQCVDGDMALCEASLSARCFYKLVELGVPFPCTEYNEYVGYRTDHDSTCRATSAGPYTSKLMTECLEAEVEKLGIKVYDHFQVVRLLVDDGTVRGVVCLERKNREASYYIIWCKNVVMATGGPAGMYKDSVYPGSQLGSSGIAFEAGVKGKNLTEWQFGMASRSPRWNVSGTYMQVLPCFISTDESGGDEKEFLLDFYKDPNEMLSHIFLKGYQWPFDVDKIFGGSSMIDLLVYWETIIKGRRVYLDYTRDTAAGISFEQLSCEAYQYLKSAGALVEGPINRLAIMNEPAIEFYKTHGIDLYSDRLEISVCAQHNNGGLSTNEWWETNIHNLFAIGELCGSHGVNRPGGSALNAGQVGAVRAAERIYRTRQKDCHAGDMDQLRKSAMEFISSVHNSKGTICVSDAWRKAEKRMSECGGIIRERESITKALAEVRLEIERFYEDIKVPEGEQLSVYYHLRDMLLSQFVYLSAMEDYISHGVGSRGSALYTDVSGDIPNSEFPDIYRCRLDRGAYGKCIQEIELCGGKCRLSWRQVRPVPTEDYFFEKQWMRYRKRMTL